MGQNQNSRHIHATQKITAAEIQKQASIVKMSLF